MSFSLFGCRFGRCILYQRYIAAMASALVLINLYAMRYALTAAIPYLQGVRIERNVTKQNVCETIQDEIHKTLGSQIKWTKQQQNYIQSFFYVTYITTQIPSGILCDLYGPRHILSFGMAMCGLLTMITPIVIERCSWWVMLFLRICVGGAQGFSMTAMFTLAANWMPERQITFLTSLTYSGGSLGNAIFTGTLTLFYKVIGSWVSLFYFWGAMTIAWYCFYLCLVFSTPASHPFVSKEEKDLLENEIGVGFPKSIPWREILSENSVWALLAGQLGHNWILFVLASNLPKYFRDVLGFNITSNFVLLFVPYACMWAIVLISGLLGDHLINKKYIPVVYLRTIYTAIGNILPSIFILIAMYIGCRKSLLLLFFTLAMMCKGTYFAGLKANILDITRHYVGVVYGIENGLAGVTGLLSPVIIQYMCPDNTVQQWRKVFWLSFAICIFTTTLYFIWSKSDRASWDSIEDGLERM